MKPYLFLDRDGTMGGDYYVKRPQDFQYYAGTREACRLLREAGFPIIIVTNQACIARGLDGGYDFAAEFREIGAKDWFICPHDAKDACHCRKPETGLLEQARDKYGLDLSQCYMIGDRWTDMVAGGRMGMRLITVKTGRGLECLNCDRKRWTSYHPDYIADDLLDAAHWLLSKRL